MSITKKNDPDPKKVRWIVNLKPGGRTGKQVKRIFKTQTEAKQFANWHTAKHTTDPEWTPAAREARKLSDLITLWHAHHGAQLEAGKDTHARLKAMCLALGNPAAANFTSQNFAEYRTNRLEQGISRATLNREHAYLRSVFNELSRLGLWTKENPLKRIRQFKLQENELAYLTLDQTEELLEALEKSVNPHVLLVTKICLSTGARWGEAEGLGITQVRNGVVQFAETKSKKTRALPIGKELQDEIHAHHKTHSEDQKIFGSAHAAFRSGIGRTSIVLPKGQLAHVLRHTFASHYMIEGGNILALQKALGHASLTMTMRYAHLSPDHMQDVLTLNPLSTLHRIRTPVGSSLEVSEGQAENPK